MASAVVFAAYALLAAAIERGVLSADMQQQVGVVPPLLAVFGIINALVAVFVNPWRVDRLPDRFPTIVQDVIVIGLFAVAATLILQEKSLPPRRSARWSSALRCRTRSATCSPGWRFRSRNRSAWASGSGSPTSTVR
jgi:hypothetical protein